MKKGTRRERLIVELGSGLMSARWETSFASYELRTATNETLIEKANAFQAAVDHELKLEREWLALARQVNS